jgi:T-complex protein 1 subunit zeta
VLLIGELLKQCERYLAEGMHPRVLVEGFETAKKASLEFLEEFKTPIEVAVGATDREMVRMVARTSLVCTRLSCLSTNPESSRNQFG